MDLVAADGRGAIVDAMHRYAGDRGFGDGTVFFEPFAPAVILYDMLTELDRSEPAIAVGPRLHRLAQAWGVDLERVFASTRGADVLWQLIERLEESGDAHLIVPDRDHLSDLGPTGRAAAVRLAESRTVAVHFLDAASGNELSVAADPELRVLVETPIGAIPAVAQLDVATELIRLGLIAEIEAIDAVYVALIDEVDAASRGASFLSAGPDADPAVIRLLTTGSGQLIVELEEPCPRTDAVGAALTELCEHTDRFIDRGRTWTRCVIRSAFDAGPGERP